MARSAAQKKANRRVAAQRSTCNIVSGLTGLLLNETMRPEECVRVRAAMAELEENLKNWKNRPSQ